MIRTQSKILAVRFVKRVKELLKIFDDSRRKAYNSGTLFWNQARERKDRFDKAILLRFFRSYATP